MQALFFQYAASLSNNLKAFMGISQFILLLPLPPETNSGSCLNKKKPMAFSAMSTMYREVL